MAVYRARLRAGERGPRRTHRNWNEADGQRCTSGVLLLERAVPESAQRGASGKRTGYSDMRVVTAGISGWMAAKLLIESGPCRR